MAGGGVAGVAAAISASELGADVIIAEGTGGLAPNRSLFSGLLSGESTSTSVVKADPGDLAERLGIDVRFGEPVLSVDVASRSARTKSGRIRFDSLVVATGSSYGREDLKGASKQGVFFLGALEDYTALSGALDHASRLAVIGPIPLALPVAEAASQKTQVSVFLGGGILSGFARRAIQRISEAASSRRVSLVLERAEAIVGVRRAEAVISAGAVHPCDRVAVLPRSSPSPPSLDCARGDHGGLLVDASMRTSCTSVFAAGDCAEQRIGSGTAVARLQSSSLTMGTVAGINSEGGAAKASLSRCAAFVAFGVELCSAGVDAELARAVGLDAVEFESHDAPAGVEASLVYDRTTHRLYGAQFSGPGSLALSDCASLAVAFGASLEDLAYQETPYLPRRGRDRSPICLTAGMALAQPRG